MSAFLKTLIFNLLFVAASDVHAQDGRDRVRSALPRLVDEFGMHSFYEGGLYQNLERGTFFNFLDFGKYGVLVPRLDSSFAFPYRDAAEFGLNLDDSMDPYGSISLRTYRSLQRRLGDLRRAQTFGGRAPLGLSVGHIHRNNFYIGIRVPKIEGIVAYSLARDPDKRIPQDPAIAYTYIQFLHAVMDRGALPLDAGRKNFRIQSHRPFWSGRSILKLVPFDIEFKYPWELTVHTDRQRLAGQDRVNFSNTLKTMGVVQEVLVQAANPDAYEICSRVVMRMRELRNQGFKN